MEAAFKSIPEAEFDVSWKPYQLSPNAPTQSKMAGFMKYMQDETKVREFFKKLESEGQQTGIAFEFDGEMGDTFNAHRLAEWALTVCGSGAQDKLVEAQFSEYMETGSPPCDNASLLRAVEKVGLDVPAARQVLESNAYADETKKKIEEAKDIEEVPTFYVNGKCVGYGIKSTAELEGMIRSNL